jgi:ankyrin repeat protein
LKSLILIHFFIFSSNILALEKISFAVKEPYPVCIQEVREKEPNLPISFFNSIKEKAKEKDLESPCNDFISNEVKRNNLSGLTSFFQNDFSKIEQELFAKDLIKDGNYLERLKLLNNILLQCQERTEKFHKLAALAADNIYNETDSEDFVPEGYVLSDKKTDFFVFPDSDVKGYILHPKNPNDLDHPPIIAFAGTRSLKSVVSDLTYGSSQVNNIKVKFIQWINGLKKEGQKELIITGHSLGGGLAQTLSAMIPEPNEIKTHVVTFNGFGGKDAIKAYNTIYGGADKDKDYDKFQPTRDAVGYRIAGDVVSLLGSRFGEARVIPTTYSSLSLVHNHLMGNFLEKNNPSPHLLMNAKKEDTELAIRPISFIVKGATLVTSIANKISDAFDSLSDKDCITPFNPKDKNNGKCENTHGDALLCLKEGKELKTDGKNIVPAMEKFKTGCNLCSKDSCMEYAILNKVVGYGAKTFGIAKKACDLGDSASCIEAGTIFSKQNQTPILLDNKYITLGCANGATELCKRAINPEFAKSYNNISQAHLCDGVKSIDDCEVFFIANSNTQGQNYTTRLTSLLAKPGINVNIKNTSGLTPLIKAVMPANDQNENNDNSIDIVKILVNAGAKINIQDNFGNSPLMMAAKNKNTEITQYFLKKHALIEETNKEGNTAIMEAALSGQFEQVKLLTENNAKTNLKNKDGESLIFLATYNSNPDLLKYLVQKNANINDQNKDGNNVIMNSIVFKSSNETIKFLINHGADFNVRNKSGSSAILNSFNFNNLELIKTLADNGANFDIHNNNGITPLHYASKNNNPEIVQYLLAKKANINAADIEGNTPLINIAKNSDQGINVIKVAKLLLEKDANIEAEDKEGNTALMSAARQGDSKLVELLLSKNANKAKYNKAGESLFTNAVYSQNLELVKKIDDESVDVNSKNSSGLSPIYHAAFTNNFEIFQYLAEVKKANLNVSYYGSSLISGALANGNLKTAQYLVSKGVKLDKKDENGDTPLISSISNDEMELNTKQLEVIKYCLDNGGKNTINLASKDGSTPLEIAIERDDLTLVKLLVSYGAKIDKKAIKLSPANIGQFLQERFDNPYDLSHSRPQN